MRHALVLWHRWVGLVIAAFVFVAGATGAVISWDHELDSLLNPHLTEARAVGPALPSLDLAVEVEARHPDIRVTYVPLAAEPGSSLSFGVSPRLDQATGRLTEPGFNEVFVDPASGEELGRRDWGAVWPISGENVVSFLYVLHYSLHVPAFWGIDLWGVWLMGVIAVLWTVDCFVGFYLTLPTRRRAPPGETAPGRRAAGWWSRWKPAWRIKWSGSSYRINFDLHRAFGLWTWALLFILAFTAFSMNFYSEVFFPAMSLVSDVTPSPFDLRDAAPLNAPIEPRLGFGRALAAAGAEAAARGWPEPAGSLFYSPDYGIYGVSFFSPEDGHGVGGVGHRTLYLDGLDGRLLGDYQPWTGTVADIFVQAQFPLHSGRILGLPGRILVSIMGVVVAALSVTGVVIWWRKRRARVAGRVRIVARRTQAAPAE